MKFIKHIKTLFSKNKQVYQDYEMKFLDTFNAIITSINAKNVKEKTLEAETLFLNQNWDARYYLLDQNAQYIPSVENWEHLAPTSFLPKLFLGSLYINKGWDIRGGDYADKVLESSWEGFEDYLIKAFHKINESIDLHPEIAQADALMLTLAVGTSNTELRNEAYKKGNALQPENIYLHRDMLWALTPRWNCDEDASLAIMEDFLKETLAALTTPNKYYLWFSYIEECENELEDEDYEDFINDEIIRQQTYDYISTFQLDAAPSIFKYEYANLILLTAYEMEISHPKLPDIAALVLPNAIYLNVWDDYADTPKEVAKYIGKVLKNNL